ncbi:serine-type D-Ala-D-Ala carboxypeptidase [Vibrio hippocampi]|uniref:D-alanyl-D-alanine carboxypeptidase DacB n=1 Tax=Vibrio hippocampi TaxID=654686 RepID=A0ABM8ZIX8_9VIBR|nr:serine-type D-Ala-D-Ala carboxypeptidase [Vibrio hippocampi]CAH0526783.1 D-alanyl-D-alanine carboxypeptidase DacB [Vibrio hippocampi]
MKYHQRYGYYSVFTLLILCVQAFCVQAHAADSILPYGSRHALYLAPLSEPAKPVVATNSDQFFPPASTLKVVTALAAKLQLGDQFRFNTELKKLNNDYIIQYSGDPSFSRADLRRLLTQIAKSSNGNITHIWLDNRAFTGYQHAVGWPWDILGVCYSAPTSAITLDGNCVQGALYTNKDGSTRVNVPKHQPISVNTSVHVTQTANEDSPPCQLDLVTYQDNRYQLSGCVGYRQSPLPLKFAVVSPQLFTQAVIKDELAKLNVKSVPQVKVGVPNNSQYAKTILVHRSAPLPELLTVMLQQSNNLYADSLTKTLGMNYFAQAGSFSNGTQAIKEILRDKADIDLSLAVLEDGSGLSRNNRLTADQLVQVLKYIYQNDQNLNLIALLPTSGVNGTLRYRSSMRKAPISQSIRAKSGSLFGSYNMAGYGLDSQGKPNSVFVQFVSDYHPKANKAPSGPSPLQRFEEGFYRQVVELSQ